MLSNKAFWQPMVILPCSWMRTRFSRPAEEREKNPELFFQEGYDIVIGSRVLQSDTASQVKALPLSQKHGRGSLTFLYLLF